MFINNAFADTDTITLQGSESTPESPPAIESGLTSLVPMVLIFVVFYFLLIRPQEKKRRSQETLVSGVKKGEEVLTNAGIYGVVTQINDSDNTITLRIANDVEIKMQKNSIADIVSRSKGDNNPADKKANIQDEKKKTFAKKNASAKK
ncbi:MAG: preprotein translocase subunit YajC [Rickettsiaceae bacterium]|jgi:preprotein translocase subunit YajC|nr:preprotein translocase subunit YajC [Rickettsiaceae bacterium]